MLQTEHPGGGGDEQQDADRCPARGQRNFAYLARLRRSASGRTRRRDAANGGFSAGGVRGNGQNNFLLNGVDNNVNTIDFLNQPLRWVLRWYHQRMSVQTNGFNAEYAARPAQ